MDWADPQEEPDDDTMSRVGFCSVIEQSYLYLENIAFFILCITFFFFKFMYKLVELYFFSTWSLMVSAK